jgi:menaquinone-specific isochorismate synthase
MNGILTLAEIKERLAADVQQAMRESQSWVRVEYALAACDLLTWLRASDAAYSVYWSSPKLKLSVAGIGAADVICGASLPDFNSPLNRIAANLDKTHPQKRYFGGFSFAPELEQDTFWPEYGAYHFWLPRFEIIEVNGKYLFACNAAVSDESVFNDIQKLPAAGRESNDPHYNLIRRSDVPNRPEWIKAVDEALQAIAHKKLEKIVLARQADFQFAEKIDPYSVLHKLRVINHESIYFAFRPASRATFLGGTPELLYRRSGRELCSEAVAGTRVRGKNETEDRQLENELLNSNKDLREQRFVFHSVRNALESLSTRVSTGDQVSVLKLARLQHLYNQFTATLNKQSNDADIIEALHPTPAVGGFPKEITTGLLRELEHFERGWYAAPVGWLSHDAAEFAVAIRSGLVHDNQLRLFSGAGIVPGSDPSAEWDEIESKIGNFLKIFEINGNAQGKHQQPVGVSDYRRAN